MDFTDPASVTVRDFDISSRGFVGNYNLLYCG